MVKLVRLLAGARSAAGNYFFADGSNGAFCATSMARLEWRLAVVGQGRDVFPKHLLGSAISGFSGLLRTAWRTNQKP